LSRTSYAAERIVTAGDPSIDGGVALERLFRERLEALVGNDELARNRRRTTTRRARLVGGEARAHPGL
jgi:hypothetical protein